MVEELKTTTPKPFVFVLMPFHDDFSDIYEFGIRGAADDAGAYAERIDKQMFDGNILDRLYNQINKADVIVADMTGRNPNVFYEVGYAHALGKIVLLLTKEAEDIPFDLKHHTHIVYGGKIGTLRGDLTKRLLWAIDESKRRTSARPRQKLLVTINGRDIPEIIEHLPVPLVPSVRDERSSTFFRFDIQVRNGGRATTERIDYIYLLASEHFGSHWKPEGKGWEGVLNPSSEDLEDGYIKQYQSGAYISSLPIGAMEQISLKFRGGTIEGSLSSSFAIT